MWRIWHAPVVHDTHVHLRAIEEVELAVLSTVAIRFEDHLRTIRVARLQLRKELEMVQACRGMIKRKIMSSFPFSADITGWLIKVHQGRGFLVPFGMLQNPVSARFFSGHLHFYSNSSHEGAARTL